MVSLMRASLLVFLNRPSPRAVPSARIIQWHIVDNNADLTIIVILYPTGTTGCSVRYTGNPRAIFQGQSSILSPFLLRD